MLLSQRREGAPRRLLPRVRRSLAFARDDSCVVVLSEAKDLLGWGYCQESEVPRFCSG
ncbi:Uncharacterised protein [Legionella maceachernii]|nr:hypothetical protein SAMN02745128_00851 [Legionella maceachernii]SUP02291.1 Uncharacterised protein [Legionella maceachernii]